MSEITGTTLLYLGVGSLGLTFTGLVLRYILKSKCSHISFCCGMVACDRNVQLEEKIEEFKSARGISNSVSNENIPISISI
jgi:hypothetical protein